MIITQALFTQLLAAGLIVCGKLTRPAWICSKTKQVVIFVRDRSSSMAGAKAVDATAAGGDLVEELAQPVNKDGFIVGIVDFSSSAGVIHDLTKATELQGKVIPIGPDGSTNITSGLDLALALIQKSESQTPAQETLLRPVVILFSDGGHNTGPVPHDVACRIRDRADLVTVAFGSDADDALLRDLATSPQHFYRCANGRQLRGFLAAVGATITGTMAAGKNATQALGAISQP